MNSLEKLANFCQTTDPLDVLVHKIGKFHGSQHSSLARIQLLKDRLRGALDTALQLLDGGIKRSLKFFSAGLLLCLGLRVHFFPIFPLNGVF